MPNPKQYGSEAEWMKSFMHQRKQEHPEESHEQSVAIGLSMWRNRKAEVISDLAKVANTLDNLGLIKQASMIDEVLGNLIKE
jgi:hypothetical protein